MSKQSDSKRRVSDRYAWNFAKEIAKKAGLDYEKQIYIYIELLKVLDTWETRFNFEWEYKHKGNQALPEAVLKCSSAVSFKELTAYADDMLFGKIDGIYDVDIFYMLINTIDRWSKALLKQWEITYAYLKSDIGKTIYRNGKPYMIRGYNKYGNPILSKQLFDPNKIFKKKDRDNK